MSVILWQVAQVAINPCDGAQRYGIWRNLAWLQEWSICWWPQYVGFSCFLFQSNKDEIMMILYGVCCCFPCEAHDCLVHTLPATRSWVRVWSYCTFQTERRKLNLGWSWAWMTGMTYYYWWFQDPKQKARLLVIIPMMFFSSWHSVSISRLGHLFGCT